MGLYFFMARCHHSGCSETQSFHTSTRKGEKEMRRQRASWLCTRHAEPEKVLSPERQELSVAVVCKHHGELGRNFWAPEGAGEEPKGKAFNCSHAHNAWADDFPPGTRLVLTARVEMPGGDDV